MGWRIFQLSIIFAFMAWNIRDQWTPNPYAAAVVGILASVLATVILSGALRLIRLLPHKLRSQ